jgi:predicted permease
VSYAHQFSEMRDPDSKLERQMTQFFITLLLVVISINVAVLVYARTAARQGEIAVRTALGASRGRIIAQMFIEGLVLAGLGALAGVFLSAVALDRIRQTLALSQEEPLPFWYRFTVSGETITYVVALTALAAALIGALPAWKATGSKIQNRLQALSAGGGSGMHLGRVWTALILLQVAFAVSLLPTVMMVGTELAGEAMASPGFAANEYLVAQLSAEAPSSAPPATLGANESFARQYRSLEARIAETGTTRAITFSAFVPGSEPGVTVRSEAGGPDASVEVNRVAVNFFETFGARMLAGRNFTNADAAPQGRSVIVSRSFAEVLPPGAAVLGSRIRLATAGKWSQATSGLSDDWYQIVGLVENFPAPRPGAESPEPKVYRAVTPEASTALTLTLHVHAAEMASWVDRVRHIAAGLDPTLQLTNVKSMDALFAENQRNARLLAGVLAILVLSVLLLSAAGIYAMMSFAVMQRRREIGIRLVLGAGARTILWTIFSRAGVQLALGAVLGTAVALLLNHAENGELLGDRGPVVLTTVVLLMMVAGLLAALGPARRGLRIEPTEALRDPSR